MPILRKLAQEEVQAIQQKGKSQRQLVAQEYDQLLANFSVGDYGLVEIAENESRITVSNRLRSAAGRKQVFLRFSRSQGNIMRFEVLETQASQDTDNGVSQEERSVGSDTPPDSSPPKKRAGRPPRKHV